MIFQKQFSFVSSIYKNHLVYFSEVILVKKNWVLLEQWKCLQLDPYVDNKINYFQSLTPFWKKKILIIKISKIERKISFIIYFIISLAPQIWNTIFLFLCILGIFFRAYFLLEKCHKIEIIQNMAQRSWWTNEIVKIQFYVKLQQSYYMFCE